MNSDNPLITDPPQALTSGEVTPEALVKKDYWVPWALTDDGRKQPRAPHIHGHSYPAEWNCTLPEEKHPATDLETVEQWTQLTKEELEEQAPLPDESPTDTLRPGLILPVDRPPRTERITLIDWDNVRDPETGELHPVAAEYIRGGRTYAEISQTGKGVHQLVFGGLRDRGKFIAEIDEEPFIGDDAPQVEIYDGGRHVACTREHVQGTRENIGRGQDLIDELVEEYSESDSSGVAFGEYEIGDPPKDRPICYHAALQAREDPPETIDSFTVNSYAGMLGIASGYEIAQLLADFEEHSPDYGFDKPKTEEHLETLKPKLSTESEDESPALLPPSPQKLHQTGILPEETCSPDCPIPGHGDATTVYFDGDMPSEFEGLKHNLEPADVWEIWSESRVSGDLGPSARVPAAALRHISEEHHYYDFSALDDADSDLLPAKAHNKALWWVNSEWSDEHLEEDEQATARDYKPRDATVYTWEDVRYIYQDSKDQGRKAARTLLSNRYVFMTVTGTETLLVYDEDTGIFTERTGPIRGEIYEQLGEHWSTHELNEITAGLRQQTVVEPRHLDAGDRDAPLLCVANGVLNLYTRELHDHSPEYHFTSRVPVEYDPGAGTEIYEEFVAGLTEREADKKALFEMVGHALVPDANERYKKFLILTGDADNGKSMFYHAVETLLNGPDGEESNTAGVKLAKLAQNRFSIHAMHGSLANIAGEIDGKKIRNTANLKDITGGDEVEIEPKGQDSFFDTLGTTLMFAANDPPILGERDKKAIASRIVPVELPYTFVEDPDPDDELEKQRVPEQELKADLEDPEALSGFLNLALDGLDRLEENGGDVSLPESLQDRLERYERSADPMREFGTIALENDPDDYLVKADVTTLYKEYAQQQGYEVGSNINPVLHGVLRGLRGLNYTDSRPRNPDYSDTSLPLKGWQERKVVLDRVTLTEEGLELAENAGLVADEVSEEGESETFDTLATLEPGYHREIEATVKAVSRGEYNREAQGALQGTSPAKTWADFVVPGGNKNQFEGKEGEKVLISNVRVRHDEQGLVEVVVNDAGDVERKKEDDSGTGPDPSTGDAGEGAATDGGPDKIENVKPHVVRAVRKLEVENSGMVPRSKVVKHLISGRFSQETVEHGITSALEDGAIHEPKSRHYRST